MKYSLLTAAIMVIAFCAPAAAQADGSIGVWRWLGLGWGSGYHAGGPPATYPWHPGGHQHPPAGHSHPHGEPGWQQPWEAPRELGPALAPIPEKSARRRPNLAPAFSPSEPGPAFPQNLESARRNTPVR